MANELQLVVVTPETTIVDEPVSTLRFPLFDDCWWRTFVLR